MFDMPFSVKIYIFAFLLFLAWCVFECEYQAIKSYYPRLTRMEYIILGDKIRITPD